MTAPKPIEEDEVVGPARVTPLHAQDREFSKAIGPKRGWRKLSPLQAAYERGQLAQGNGIYTPEQRFEAGSNYAQAYLTSQASGRDSTDLDRIMGSGRGSSALSQAQVDAIRSLVSIDSHLSPKDRKIIRLVCGEGYFPSEAIAHVCGPQYAKATMARFCEALDSLIESFEAVNRHGLTRSGTFNLSRDTRD